jgi:alpha-galactosidase
VAGKQTVRDLWRQKNVGVYDQSFRADVASHGVVLVRVIPSK